MLKKNEKFTDTELVRKICSVATERDEALHYIFVVSGWRKEASSKIQMQGYDVQDVKDAIQEAMIILDRKVRDGSFDKEKSLNRKVRDGSFDKEKSLKNYFLGICEGRAYSFKRSRIRISSEEEMPIVSYSETPETEYFTKETKNLVRRLLDQLDEVCKELLTHYMLSFSMKEIQTEMQISSGSNTRKKAFECRQKLALLINNSNYLKKYFETTFN